MAKGQLGSNLESWATKGCKVISQDRILGYTIGLFMNYTEQKKHIVRRNRRLYVPEGLYFITGVTRQREPIFKEDAAVEILRQTLRNIKQLYPFMMQAYTFLPDHFHIMLRPGPSVTISQIMHSFKRNFTWNYKKAKEIPRSTSVHLWQDGSWDHVIRDETDCAKHFDYIHYNAVKHEYVARPEDFLNSSYMIYVEKGMVRDWLGI